MPIYTLSDSSSGSQDAANGETLTAETAQDNPVGITEKYIYIIRNYINDKVYIGQAIDPESRFRGHISDAKRKAETSAIDGAINKYGAENFYYEILEEKTPDYNEREKYWISFYNSVAPNGYNIMRGGEDPPVRKGFANNMCKFTPEDIEDIKRLLLNPSVTLNDIARSYGVAYHTISSINKGKTYKDESIDYPIRKFQCSGESGNMLSSNTVNAVIYDLANTDDSMRQIAIRYHINDIQVASINDGSVIAYRRDWLEYPIRESPRLSKETVKKIQDELIAGVKSKNQIATECGVKYSDVSDINSGRRWFDENLVYPLKKHEGRYDYGEDLWEEVRARLKAREDPKKIASDLHLPNVSMVHDINKGKTHVSENYTYPIRTFENKYSDELILEITNKIAHTNISLSDIAKEYGMHKSTVLQLKNGAAKKYRIDGFTYPLR